MADRPKGMGKGDELIERNSDVGEWGEKDVRGAYDGPLEIAGEKVELDKTPALSEGDKPKAA